MSGNKVGSNSHVYDISDDVRSKDKGHSHKKDHKVAFDECDIHDGPKSKSPAKKPAPPPSTTENSFLSRLFKPKELSTTGPETIKKPDTTGHDVHQGINLSKFGSLQLPTGTQGKVDTVSGNLTKFNNPNFKQGDGKIVFTVPHGSTGVTANSKNPRCELAEGKTWKMSQGPSTESGTLSVEQSPHGGVAFAQIHQRVHEGAPRPPVELRYEDGNVYASIMKKQTHGQEHSSRKEVKIASGIQPGEKFSYNMSLGPGGKLDISITHKGKTSKHAETLDHSLLKADCYFKAGNYPQNPKGGSKVSYYNLNISHSGPEVPKAGPAKSPGTSTAKTDSTGASKPGPAGGKFDPLIKAASKKYGVPEAMIKSVIQQESGGNPNAVNSTSGCTGLMQLKPAYFGRDGANLKDPAINIDRGTKELARLLKVKNGDPVAALAAYNLGENANIDTTVPGQHGLTGRQYAKQVLARFQ